MEKITKIKSLQSTSIDSSFEEEISEINSELQKETDSEKSKKYLEDLSLDEIYIFVDEIDKNNSKDLNSIFTKEKKINHFLIKMIIKIIMNVKRYWIYLIKDRHLNHLKSLSK